MIYRMVRPKNKIFSAPVAAGKISLSYSYSQTQIKPSLQAMKKPFTFSVLLCALFCLLHVSSSRAACKPAAAIAQTADYSCSYFDDMTGKYYCVETSAACDVAHAFVKESGSTGSPTLIVLTYQGNMNGCQYFEGSLQLPTGSTIVVGVVSCGCGSSITTHVFFV